MAYADAKSDHVVESCQVSGKKKLVVLGTGWAGMSFLKNLDASLYDVQVVSPRNYFVFTPLLPSITCGTVEPRSIVEPIRNIIRKVGVDGFYYKHQGVSYVKNLYNFVDCKQKKMYLGLEILL